MCIWPLYLVLLIPTCTLVYCCCYIYNISYFRMYKTFTNSHYHIASIQYLCIIYLLSIFHINIFFCNACLGHYGRRTGATIAANHGASLFELQRMGNWRSETVAKGYIDESSVTVQRNAVLTTISPIASSKSHTSKYQYTH